MSTKPYRKVLSTSQVSLSARIDQIRSSIPHAAETGALIERLIRSELEIVLPEKIAVADGFVVDAEGRTSKQMDIILYDKLNTPRIFASDGAQIFPVETTYAAGEIKTKLDGTSLRKTFEQCLSYKSLARKAYFEKAGQKQQTLRLFGKEFENWQSVFFCIAVESVCEETLLLQYRKLCAEMRLTYDKRVDTIVALDGRCLLNSTKPLINHRPQERSISLLPEEENQFAVYSAKEPWALFVHLLMMYMVQVPQVIVNMLAYDSGEPF